MASNYDGLTKNSWTGTWASSGDHPITLSNETRGGVHSVSGGVGDQLTDITGQRLQEGMLVFNVAEDKYYRYTLLDGEFRNSSTGDMPNNIGNWILTSVSIDTSATELNANTYTDTAISVVNQTISDLTTDVVSEGTSNLYYTRARVLGELSDGTDITIADGSIAHDAITRTDTTSTATIDHTDTFTVVDSITTSSQGHITAVNVKTVTAPSVSTLDEVTTAGNTTTNDITVGQISSGNITTSGYLRGPATFTIDPAAFGDNTGKVVIAGDLQVDGTTTTINSTTVEVDDLNITLASGSTDATSANGAGITIDLGTDGTTALIYNATDDQWELDKPLVITGGTSGDVTGNLTGDVTGTVSDISNHTTDNLAEGTNLYYTETRAREALSGGKGITYDDSTGTINSNNSVYVASTEPLDWVVGDVWIETT
jgi:hypothetical protein